VKEGVGMFTLLMLVGALTLGQGNASPALPLNRLTVPLQELGTDCMLVPSPSERINDSTFRGGLWAGLPIDSNPWEGVDQTVITDIRERLDQPVRVPDGPPLDRRQLLKFRSMLADGVAEGYAAIYRDQQTSDLITVYALRLQPNQPVDNIANRLPSGDAKQARFVNGQLVTVVRGSGRCFERVVEHISGVLR
jgi:hypothetical protein